MPPEGRKAQLAEALKRAADAIRQGELIGIFAERNISRIGVMLPFRREFERIMEGLDAPVVPVCLDGVWGSIFSFNHGRFLWKVPEQLPYPVTVSFGAPLPTVTWPKPSRAREASRDNKTARFMAMAPLELVTRSDRPSCRSYSCTTFRRRLNLDFSSSLASAMALVS